MVFAGYSGFLHYLQLASHELATFGINVTKNEIRIQTLVLSNFEFFSPAEPKSYFTEFLIRFRSSPLTLLNRTALSPINHRMQIRTVARDSEHSVETPYFLISCISEQCASHLDSNF